MLLPKSTMVMLALASTTFAQYAIHITNQCAEEIYINHTVGDGTVEDLNLGPGAVFGQSTVSTGSSLGVSLQSDFYATTTPKLIVGYTVDSSNELTYYSVTTQDGTPALTFDLTNDQGCATVSTPNAITYACTESVDLYLTLYDS